MISKVFSVFDRAAEAYLAPFVAPARGLALRSFEAAVNDPRSALARHYVDYVLCELGTFDDATGVLVSHSAPVRVATGSDVYVVPSRVEQSSVQSLVPSESSESSESVL